MEIKLCSVCNIEKQINSFYKRYSESKDCNVKRGVNSYYDKKIKHQFKKKYYEKNRQKLLEKQNDYRNKRNIDYKEILRSYDEIENKLKALEEKVTINDSEIN